MTTIPAPAVRSAERNAAPRDGAGQPGPVVVLAYADSGAMRLQRMLAGQTALACTSGTGVLPMCDLAAATWREVDQRVGPLSGLAAASIRSLANSLITIILARAGKSRWCEVSFAPADRAEAFLELFPAARFVCLHRRCPDVIAAGLGANPWGLSETLAAPFAGAYPGNTLAALAAYWVSCTEGLLAFEAAHPAASRRLRHEDLAGQAGGLPGDLAAFLGLGPSGSSAPPWAGDEAPSPEDEDGPAGLFPADRIPPPLLARVNDLHGRLGYPPLA